MKAIPGKPALARAGAIAFAPQAFVRLRFLRVWLPLAILGFLSSRILHAAEWLSAAGFQVPDLGRRDWRQPLYLAPLPVWAAWGLCAVLALSGLALSAGVKPRISALLFALGLFYVTLADRLEAFTVNKLGSVLALALFLVPTVWRADPADRASAGATPGERAVNRVPADAKVTWGNVRFFQLLVVILYCASGICKWKGDWLTHPYVLWTHMQDSYQTPFSYHVAALMPLAAWRPLQYVVLGFEVLAPLWLLLPWTRLPALCLGLGIHAFIGLGFGPVVWFVILMAALLMGCFAPESWLQRFFFR